MPRFALVFTAMLFVAGLPTSLLAQSGLSGITRSVRTLDKNFDVADTNRDGKLSLQEAQSGPVAFIAHHFDAIDTHHTGEVSKADVHAYIARMLMRSQPSGPAPTNKSD